MSESDFAQAMRDADHVGIPRATAYQSLKDKGYTIENEPTPKPSVKTSGGFFGYLTDVAVNALKEVGAVAKFGGDVLTHPSKGLEFGRDIIKGGATIAVGAGENLYEKVTGQQVPVFNPDGTVTYPQKSIYQDPVHGGTPEQRAATGIAKSAVESVYSPSFGQFEGEGFTLPDTFREHPLSTLSAAASMGSGLLGRTSTLSKAGEVVQAGRGAAGIAESAGFSRTAQALSTAGKMSAALDPVQAAIKAPGFAIKQGSKLTKGLMGEISGAGAGAIEEAAKAKKTTSPFFEALRDENQVAQAEKLVEETQNGLRILKQRRNAQYLKTNEALRTITEPLDHAPIQNILQKNLDDFRIGTTEKDLLGKIANMDETQSLQFLNEYMQTKGGGLSPLVEAGLGEGTASNKIAKAINYVENWSDYTPDGLDRLRKSLTSLNTKMGTTEGTFVGKLKAGIKEQVVKQFPEYSKMLGEYADASDFIDELTSSIGNMDKAGIEQHVRKLAQSMKTGNQGFEIRNALLTQLEEVTGVQIKQRLAGMALSKYTPRGLAGVGAGVGTVATLAGILSPQYLLGIAMSSPRLMGEVLGAMGVAKDQIATIITRLQDLPF